MVLNMADFGKFWKSLPNSLKRLQNHSKIICDYLRDCLCRFRVNLQGSKIGGFWAKSLGYSPWFWTWRILVSPRNPSKLSETLKLKPSKTICNSLRNCVRRLRVNSQGWKLSVFEQKAWAIAHTFWTWPILASPGNRSTVSETAHGFEFGGFWLNLEIAPNLWKAF